MRKGAKERTKRKGGAGLLLKRLAVLLLERARVMDIPG